MSHQAAVRLAREEDLHELIALERATLEAPHWQEAVYRGYIVEPASAFGKKALFVAMMGGSVQGFAAAALAAEETELESIAVAPGVRRGGVGGCLLQAVQMWAQGLGARALLLEVRAANDVAQAFYRGRGFTREGLRRGYYSAPSDDAVLLRLCLCEAEEDTACPDTRAG